MNDMHANERLIRRWFEEVWNNQNEAVIDELMSKNCRAYGLPDPDAVLVGPEGFKTLHRSFCGAFPDIHIDIKDVIASGDRVAARWKATMTHTGDNLGFPATGRKVSLDGVTIGVVKDGQITEGWNMMDMGHFFESLRSESPRE